MSTGRCQLVMPSPVGPITLTAEHDALISIRWWERGRDDGRDHAVLRAAAHQLKEYFDGRRQAFSLPLSLSEGSDFQKDVWLALKDVPYGQTVSYSDLAVAIGKRGACRAVGSALGKNPLPIVLPCHRVLAAGRKIGGFTGGLDIKQTLLALEGIEV